MKVQRLMTGGGVSPAVSVDPVMDFMDATTSNLDLEISCPFDSTAQFENECKIYNFCIYLLYVIKPENFYFLN